ncbi:hypothetical protein [Roseobacter sp.]|uniref:hypothetical protein n=1 Tax=Roseobacter sp. TaxID=1907202 RepID=UPI003296935E
MNYIAQASKAWLWYPGNGRSLPETYKLDRVSGQAAICWQHPNNSYNPVTGQNGGSFACEPLAFASKAVVSELSGDVFDLASGQVPYRLDRCKAPDQFDFDRVKFGC